MSFFSMAAWTDLMMSWVCSMLMFQVAWTRVWERAAEHQSEEVCACSPPEPWLGSLDQEGHDWWKQA